MNRKCFPSGRNSGQPAPSVPDSLSWPNTTGCGLPPAAGTRHNGSAERPSNRITPSELQLPSAPFGASQIVVGGPPAMSTFFSTPPDMNPRKRLSGDQNGRSTPSVPGNARASSASSARTQMSRLPSPSAANAMCRPSGDTTGGLGFCVPGGESNGKRTTAGGSGARFAQATPNPAARRTATAHAAHAAPSRVRRRPVTTAGRPTLNPPCPTHWSSAATSRAVCHRSSGSLARQRDTIRSSAGGVSGTSSSMGRGLVASTAAMMLDEVLPSNARWPVSSS